MEDYQALEGRERIMRVADAYAVASSNADGAAAARLAVWNEIEALDSQLRGAVDLIREIGHLAGAKATGADARAMAKRAREFVASLDQPGGR